MDTIRPRFSIVIPCYNEERLIGQTLTALQAQDFTGAYEIIVVDNNCTDNTVHIAESYGVRVVQEREPGVCWARQAGTDAASGEIVISSDADTIQPKQWLRTIDETFKRNKKIVAVAGPCMYSDGPWWGKLYPKMLFGIVSFFSSITGKPFYITATNTAFKKDAWTRYHTELTYGGDELGLLHDLKKQGKIVFNNTNPVYTSGRRLEHGLIYNLFITFILYYLLAYYLNQLFGRKVIGEAPSFRAPTTRRQTFLSLLPKYAAIVFFIAFVHLPGHATVLHQWFGLFGNIDRDKRAPSYQLTQKNAAPGPQHTHSKKS